MRCVHTIGSLSHSTGGPAYVVSPLCDAIAREGAEVQIVYQAFERGGPAVLPAWAHAVSVQGFAWPRLGLVYSPTFDRVVTKCCAHLKPNVLHDHGLWLPNNYATAAIARRLGLSLIVSPHGMLEPWALRYRGLKKWLAWWLYQRRNLGTAQVLHATGEQEAANLRRLGLKQPIALIPNGVDLPILKLPPKKLTRERTALFLGRIHPVKGLVELVEAWALVRPQQWRLILAGPDEGGHRKEVEAAVDRCGLRSVVEFHEPVQDSVKTELYRSVDLFILPSFTENFGMVVAEALACGVPVITTKGTPWERLETNRCGWWVDIGMEPLAAGIRQGTSLADAERLAMGRRGRRYVEKEFGWPGIASQMLAVYRWVLGQGPKPDCVRGG